MSCSAQGRGLYTGNQSRPSGLGTPHHGSTPPSGKRAKRPQYNLAGKCRQVWGPPVYRCPHCIERPGRKGLVGKGCLRLRLIWRRSPLHHPPLGSQLTAAIQCSATSYKSLPDLPWVRPQCRMGRSTQRDGRRLCSSPSGCSKVNHRRRSVRTGLCRMSHSRLYHWDRCCAARRCTLPVCILSHRSLCIPRCRGTLDGLPLSCCRCQVCNMRWGRMDLVCKGPQG